MQPSPVQSLAAAAGLAERFQYWLGRSAHRYLFTETPAPLVADFDDAVAIAVANGRIVWAGEAHEAASFPVSARVRACRMFVHLLAATGEERQAIVADLRPAQPALALAA